MLSLPSSRAIYFNYIVDKCLKIHSLNLITIEHLHVCVFLPYNNENILFVFFFKVMQKET